MKAAAFAYSRPASIEEACALLAADDGARLIAGGQTLVPLMAMRLARPTRLVDIARLPGLAFVREEGDAVAIGAATTQRMAEGDPLVRAKLPLLARALPFVGHTATRARGTVGGSLANADSAAEIALVAVTLGATLSYREGERDETIAAADFFMGPMATALPITAVLTGVRFPAWRERVGTGFQEISSRRSDFAFASAAAQVALDPDGTPARASPSASAQRPGCRCGYATAGNRRSPARSSRRGDPRRGQRGARRLRHDSGPASRRRSIAGARGHEPRGAGGRVRRRRMRGAVGWANRTCSGVLHCRQNRTVARCRNKLEAIEVPRVKEPSTP